MNPDVKLEKLKEMLSLLSEGLTREEFVSSFKEVLKVVKDIKDTSSKEWTDLKEAVKAISDKLNSDVSTGMSDLEHKVSQVFIGERLKKLADDLVKSSLEKVESKMAEIDARMEKVQDGYTPVKGKDYFDGRDGEHGNMLKPVEVRDKLETLKGDERLEQSAIKGLEEEIKALRKEIATKASGGSRRVFQPYVDDFTASTNGVLKSFVLSREPLKTNTILVWGTDFPIILRPTTDFTVSGKTLTLTSAVPAPNTGATLLIQYYA